MPRTRHSKAGWANQASIDELAPVAFRQPVVTATGQTARSRGTGKTKTPMHLHRPYAEYPRDQFDLKCSKSGAVVGQDCVAPHVSPLIVHGKFDKRVDCSMPDKLAERNWAIRLQIAIACTKQLPGCLDLVCLHRLPFGQSLERLDENRPSFIHIGNAKTRKSITGECSTGVGKARPHRLRGVRKEIKDAQAPPIGRAWPDSRGLSPALKSAVKLPGGFKRICRNALQACKTIDLGNSRNKAKQSISDPVSLPVSDAAGSPVTVSKTLTLHPRQ